MPTPTPLQLPTGLGESRSGAVSIERLVNMYAVQSPSGAVHLRASPGLSLWASVGSGPIRGMHVFGPDLFVVSGSELYALDKYKQATLLGDIGGGGYVAMDNDESHVGIATSIPLYYANRTVGAVELGLTNINGVAYQDGYTMFTDGISQDFWHSDLDDMTTIGGLSFAQANDLAGNLRGCVNNQRSLWIFKTKSAEIYQNTGGVFPFSRAHSIETGCASPHSIAKYQGTIYWLGHDLRAYASQGYQPQAISDDWAEIKINAASGHTSAIGSVHLQDGHPQYTLSLSDLTLVFDAKTGRWHERSSEGMDRWRGGRSVRFDNINLTGDSTTGAIYEIDTDTHDEDGSDRRWEITTAPINAATSGATMHEFYLEMEMGVGLNTGQGSDPQIMLDWSDDGGKTWSHELTRSAGKIGEYTRRAKWNRLGAFRKRIIRIACSDPVDATIVAAHARVGGLAR